MDLSPEHALRNLLTAYGYNLYEKKNAMRADDLLVRERAAAALGEAVVALSALRTEYAQRFIPPLSHENPDPPRDRLDALHRLARLQERINTQEARVRGMVVPTQDRVWEHFRKEKHLLQELLQQDLDLIRLCEDVREAVLSLTPDDWGDETAARVEGLVQAVDRGARERAEFLQVPR